MKKPVINIINNKIGYGALFFAAFVFIVLIARLGFLSLSPKIDGIDIQTFAKNRTTRKTTLKASRGNIYDDNGNILAQDVSSYTLIAYLDPKRSENSKKPQHVVDKEMTARALSEIIDLDYDSILKYLSKENIYQTEFGPKGKGLNEIVKDKIDKLELPGIDFIESKKRYYPYGDFASYLIGYAKDKDDSSEFVGELGVEKYLNDKLKGLDGYTIYQKDRNGYKIANTESYTEEAINGSDVHLTIDNNVQFFVDEAMKKTSDYDYESMSIVVAEADTGKILAYSTTPSFDPNKLNITNYLDNNSSVAFEPGSTMKTYVYMAAMEAGVYSGKSTYKSGTFTTKDKTVIKDWNNTGWGWITFDQGYIYSSNIAVVNIMDKYMDAKTLKKYFIKLGFGEKTGVFESDIDETDNSMEQGGKLDFKYETEIFNAAFGQGITTTPLQHIKALTSIANNGTLLKPYLISKIVDDKGNVTLENKRTELGTVAKQSTVDYMKNLMWHNINDDDGAGLKFRIKGYDIIGKTGTAQIPKTNGSGYEKGENAYHRSVALMFPKDNPKIIIYGVTKWAPTHDALAKAVKEIIVNVSKYYGIYEDKENSDSKNELHVDNYLNKDVNTIKNELSTKNINLVILGNGDRIINQYPINSKIIPTTKVFILTNDADYKMIDLTGYSKAEVKTFCDILKLNCNYQGDGYVKSQSISVDTSLLENKNLEVVLELPFSDTKITVEKKEDT